MVLVRSCRRNEQHMQEGQPDSRSSSHCTVSTTRAFDSMSSSRRVNLGLLAASAAVSAAAAAVVTPPSPSQILIEPWGRDSVRVRWVLAGTNNSGVQTSLPGVLDPTPPATSRDSSTSITDTGGTVENGNIRVGWTPAGVLEVTRVDDGATLLQVVSADVRPCVANESRYEGGCNTKVWVLTRALSSSGHTPAPLISLSAQLVSFR